MADCKKLEPIKVEYEGLRYEMTFEQPSHDRTEACVYVWNGSHETATQAISDNVEPRE
jgi:hypothetical protein